MLLFLAVRDTGCSLRQGCCGVGCWAHWEECSFMDKEAGDWVPAGGRVR